MRILDVIKKVFNSFLEINILKARTEQIDWKIDQILCKLEKTQVKKYKKLKMTICEKRLFVKNIIKNLFLGKRYDESRVVDCKFSENFALVLARTIINTKSDYYNKETDKNYDSIVIVDIKRSNRTPEYPSSELIDVLENDDYENKEPEMKILSLEENENIITIKYDVDNKVFSKKLIPYSNTRNETTWYFKESV